MQLDYRSNARAKQQAASRKITMTKCYGRISHKCTTLYYELVYISCKHLPPTVKMGGISGMKTLISINLGEWRNPGDCQRQEIQKQQGQLFQSYNQNEN